MPTRLTVIMTESTPPTGTARRMAEAVVGELIGLPGIDLTLVESLDTLDAGSTDRLTLDGIRGDVCVLDWKSPEAIERSLRSIGFPGRRAPHSHDSAAAPNPSPVVQGPTRRIYAFDLSRFDDAGRLGQALSGLRATREVRTFSLAPPSGGDTKSSSEVSSTRLGKRSIPVRDDREPPSRPPAAEPSSYDQAPDESTSPVIDLDDLVDQLDDFDS